MRNNFWDKFKEGFSCFWKKYHIYVYQVGLMLVLLAIDLVSKGILYYKVFDQVANGVSGKKFTIIPNFMYVTMALNTGGAWSMLNSFGGHIFLICVSFVGFGAMVYIFIKYHKKMNNWMAWGLCATIPGCFGNLVDRLYYDSATGQFRGVIDFIDCEFGNYIFPTFNIADSCLVVGIICFAIGYLILDSKKEKEKKEALQKILIEKENEINNDKDGDKHE